MTGLQSNPITLCFCTWTKFLCWKRCKKRCLKRVLTFIQKSLGKQTEKDWLWLPTGCWSSFKAFSREYSATWTNREKMRWPFTRSLWCAMDKNRATYYAFWPCKISNLSYRRKRKLKKKGTGNMIKYYWRRAKVESSDFKPDWRRIETMTQNGAIVTKLTNCWVIITYREEVWFSLLTPSTKSCPIEIWLSDLPKKCLKRWAIRTFSASCS